ncbi:hypothetical protein [Aeromicrobium sp. UC242_57]|uniref:hypothetical protein n=1 Tax=Aeromicrobium sp. UC242_57 TaxID=3374624 RepID=UPI0037AE9DA3
MRSSSFSPSFEVTELWQVITGTQPGRVLDDAAQITIFDSVGFAIEDFSALRYTLAAVAGTDYVSEVDLIAEPVDPKDLFGLVAPANAHIRV